jgi:hypothetical protein
VLTVAAHEADENGLAAWLRERSPAGHLRARKAPTKPGVFGGDHRPLISGTSGSGHMARRVIQTQMRTFGIARKGAPGQFGKKPGHAERRWDHAGEATSA